MFTETKAECVKTRVCLIEGAMQIKGDSEKVVDLCRLSGCRCWGQGCPLAGKKPDTSVTIKKLNTRVYPASDADSREERVKYEMEG